MNVGNVEESMRVQSLLWEKLGGRYVASGDLAVIALFNGMAKRVVLTSMGRMGRLFIEGKLDYTHTYVRGSWNVKARRFTAELSLVSPGYWRDTDTYVKVGPTIEVAVNGTTLVSRPNLCHEAENIGDIQGRHVVVHILGTVMDGRRRTYAVFSCSEDKLVLDDPFFARYAYDKRNLYDEFDGLKVEFRELFIKRGRIVKILVNPSCEEYASTVQKLYGVRVSCPLY
jgi:hypothetical protein